MDKDWEQLRKNVRVIDLERRRASAMLLNRGYAPTSGSPSLVRPHHQSRNFVLLRDGSYSFVHMGQECNIILSDGF